MGLAAPAAPGLTMLMPTMLMPTMLMLTALGAGSAHALCVCADFEGCTSAVACDGKSPSDTCSPPRNASCKIVKGNAGGLSCCCGCSRGAGPLSCVFEPVAESVAELGTLTCGNATLERTTGKVVRKVQGKLRSGQSKCAKGKTKGVPGKLRGAKRGLSGVERKLDRLFERGEIDATCADTYRALARELIADVDELASPTPPDSSTTSTSLAGSSTTSTTLPPSGCSGTFTFFATDVNEVDMTIICPPGSYTGFTITPMQPRQITNFLTPAGFTCDVLAGGTWDCVGNFSGGPTPIDAGRIRTMPAPTAGMGGTMTVLQGMTELGPLPVTGP